jgi:sarcosine oxidase subunit gamma
MIKTGAGSMSELTLPPNPRLLADDLVYPRDTTFSVTPAPSAARFIFRGATASISAFGLEPPERLRASVQGGRAALWLGPDEFLLIAVGEEPDGVEDQVQQRLEGQMFSLVDVSHRQIALIVEGRRAARCLSAGCPLDLRLGAYPVGAVARTIFLKTEIVLWRQDEHRFHVEVWRSFAPYLVGHLAEARAGAP